MLKARLEAGKADIELQKAARNGNIKLMGRLLAKGARVNAQDVDGWTSLHAAAAEGHLSAIQHLCARDDVDVNIETNDGRTALYLASLDGNEDCVRELLKTGADAHVLNSDGKGAHDVAVLFDRTNVIPALEEALKSPPPPRKPERSKPNPAIDEDLKMKADSYIAPEPSQWKKTDFGKWNQMKDKDWEALEAHQAVVEERKQQSTERVSRPPQTSASNTSKDSAGVSKRRHLPYGQGRIGPPKELLPSHPNYQQYKEWMEMTKELEESSAASHKRSGKQEKLYSLKPEPEGGADPDSRNGSHGPGYTWGQSPTEVVVHVRLPKGVAKDDIHCEIKPTTVSISYAVAVPAKDKKRKTTIFEKDPLWKRVKCEESFWVLEDDNTLLTITLQKGDGQWWRCVTNGPGHTKIDSTKCKGPDLISEYDDEQQRDFRDMFSRQLRR